MTLPIGSASNITPIVPVVNVDNSKEKVEVVQDVEKEPSLEEQFDTLMRRYLNTISFSAGCGSRGQGYIDSAYTKLTQFTSVHPEFRDRLPQKSKCYDDGTGGMISCLMSIGKSNKK